MGPQGRSNEKAQPLLVDRHFQVPGKARITPLFIDMEKDPPRVTWAGGSMGGTELELRPVKLPKPFLPGKGNLWENCLFLLQPGHPLCGDTSLSLSYS